MDDDDAKNKGGSVVEGDEPSAMSTSNPMSVSGSSGRARFRLRVTTGGEEGRGDGGEDTSDKGARGDGRCETVEGCRDGNGCSCGAGGAAVSIG